MSDSKIDPRVLRVSIGVENVEDLKQDLLAAFKAVLNDA
jgi:cystathionine gamma-synthase